MAPPKVRFLTKIYHPNIGAFASKGQCRAAYLYAFQINWDEFALTS